MSKLLKDASGIYNLDHIGSIHPLPIKGDKTDQSKVTATNTMIAMNGGQVHHTAIPWSAAAAIAEDYWNGSQPPKVAAPKAAPPPPPTSEQALSDAQDRFT
jgi:hypothetical protein